MPEVSNAPVVKGSENVIEPTTTVPFERANLSDVIVNSSKEVESKDETPVSIIGDIKVAVGDFPQIGDSYSLKNGQNFEENASDLKATEKLSESTTAPPLGSTKNDGGILNNSVDAINKDLPPTASLVQRENSEIGTTKLPELNESMAINGTGLQQKQSEIEDVDDFENYEKEQAAKDELNDGERENVMALPLDNNEAKKYRNDDQTSSSLKISSVEENQHYTSTLIKSQPSTPSMSLEASSNEQPHTQESTEATQSSSRSLLDVTSKSSSATMSTSVNGGSAEETARKGTKEVEQGENSYSITSDIDPNKIDKAKANEKYLSPSTVDDPIIKNNLSSQPSVPDNETILYPVNDVAQNADSLPISAENNVIYSNKPNDNSISGNKEESSNKLIDVMVKPSQETVRTPVNNSSAEETVNEISNKVEGGETSYRNSKATSGADPIETDKAKANEKYLTTSTVEEAIIENGQSFQQSLPDYKKSFYPVNDVTQNAGSRPIPAEQNDATTNQPSDNTISNTNQVEETINKITTDIVPNDPNTTQQFADITKEIKAGRQDLFTSKKASLDSQHQIDTQAQVNNPEHHQNNENQNSLQDNAQFSNLPSTTHLENNNYEDSFLQTTDKPNSINDQFPIENDSSYLKKASTSTNSVQKSTSEPSMVHQIEQEDDLQTLTSSGQPIIEHQELDKKENRGLFATIMETVNNILPNNKKHKNVDYDNDDSYNELDRILFLNSESAPTNDEDERLFCEKLDQNNCPASKHTPLSSEKCECSWKTLFINKFSLESFLQALASKILEISELIAFLAIVACTSLFFIFGYYCFCKSSNEGALLSKLNQLESSLLASHKENAILKQNLLCTKQKLSSIEDNSFGTNDMVVSLKKELEEELLEKARLQEQIVTLQKELENAADAGIELNKIVSELLSNQTGDESIISSVEELQRQLNEQQNTILEINASLAEKSRENSELQLMIAEQNNRYETQLSDLQQDNDELEAEKGNLRSRLEEIRADFDKDITAALESKNFEIKRLQNEIVELNDKLEAEHAKWQTCMAKIEALEECLKSVKRDPNVNISQLIDVANIKADLLDTQKKYNALKDRMELELDARKLAECQLQSSTAEIEKIKQDFNQTEKDKLEAQTRLEVLSNYFKEKENQLQKELSLKETMRLKQQGETTTTVDRLTTMQEEIQSLKSQNDALRAEIEAQVAAHKAQTGTLENRAHETWLAARQSDRRFEEARAEATALRRKLTALAGGTVNDIHKNSGGPAGIGEDLANAPSPILMETTGSPILGRMPPPPFLPPPFMGPPPPFMGMPPPPPFVPPGEIRPAPLGRILSPPPQRSGHLDFDDYLDYEGSGPWHRHHTYSPPPRTYRSLSPTDSRYNYGNERDLISTYDTETDFSPPPSPRGSRRRGGGSGSEKEDYKFRHPYNNSNKSLPGNKDPISSGSDNSSFQAGKTLKSSGGKFLI